LPQRRKSSTPSNKEIEVKVRIADREAFLRQLLRFGAKLKKPRVHEVNTLYDTANGDLAKGCQIARIRVERSALRDEPEHRGAHHSKSEAPAEAPVATLTYKGPTGPSRGYKVREEHEVRVGNAQMLEALCKMLGLRPWFRYEKFRSTYALPGIKGVELDFDETPVGDYLELEGARVSIDRAARRLGFSKADYIVRSYGGLFMESLKLRGKGATINEPTPALGLPDMLFRKQSAARKQFSNRTSNRTSTRASNRKSSKIKKI
jgi:adenylate cyclase class IV